MDLSAPSSEPSDDALSLRSRSVLGLNDAVSGIQQSTITSTLFMPRAQCLFLPDELSAYVSYWEFTAS